MVGAIGPRPSGLSPASMANEAPKAAHANSPRGSCEIARSALRNIHSGSDHSAIGLSPVRLAAQFGRLERAAQTVISMMPAERQLVDGAERFIATGDIGDLPPALLALSELESSTEATPESRRFWLMEKVEQLLNSSVGGVAANIGNVTVRTGLIVLLTTLAREAVAIGVRNLVDAENEGARADAILTITSVLLGPVLNIAGALREHVDDTGTWKSYVSRLAQSGLCIGATLAAYVTGSFNGLSPDMVKTVIYVAMRQAANMVFPLTDNAGPQRLLPAAASATIYAAASAGIGALFKLLPWSGSQVYEALGTALSAAISSSINDTVFPYMQHWTRGAEVSESPLNDDSGRPLTIRASAEIPGLQKVLSILYDSGPAALCTLHATYAVLSIVEDVTADNDDARGWILAGAVFVMAMITYLCVCGTARAGSGYDVEAARKKD